MPLIEQILAGDRAALAKAITLIESTRPDHREEAQTLLRAILPATGKSIRLGITGVPGVGKSTFIETFGLYAIGQGKRVAVLAIDPSSAISGGSIMGDKTRMHLLSQHEHAFIRPSPTGGNLGGVARRTREAMLLAEAAGFDFIIVETVGVGQSETEVASMVDMFMLLLLPGSGDELQGIKKGIVELADLLVVTKADGDMAGAAKRVRADYTAALRIILQEGEWQPKVLACSAIEKTGIDDIWKNVLAHAEITHASGRHASKREAQMHAWFWTELREGLIARLTQNAALKPKIAEMERLIAAGERTPAEAAREILGMISNII